MTETLPIRISVLPEAQVQLLKIGAITNKLEAKLNFITMTAGWFTEPANEVSIEFIVNTLPFFVDQPQPVADEFIQIADDVQLSFSQDELMYICYLQLTQAEIAIAQKKHTVIPLLLDKKLTIVLNKIAQKQSLPVI